ncbi:MAG: hypothetical protein SH850_08015 [Planctomycetaceae bacterium]|nr:hypothetical protein [Planctomycetaceae bacterium]
MFTKTIRGVPPDDAAVGHLPAIRDVESDLPLYRPATELTPRQIRGEVEGGFAWESWRTDPITGKRWFAKSPIRGDEPAAEIQAVGFGAEPPADNDADADELTDRWRLALHESAHAAVTISLGGQCRGMAIHGGRGGAGIEGLTPRRHAIATASGPAAERLSSRFPIPSEAPAADRPLTVDEVLANADDVRVMLASDSARPAEERQIESDARTIAIWAITANETLPHTWAERVADVHRAAAELIEVNCSAIVRLAEGLFIGGSLNEAEVANLYYGETG